MELQSAARRPIEAPSRERLKPPLSIEHLRVTERSKRETCRVRQHLFDRDGILAIRAEFRNDVDDSLVQGERTVVEHLPDRRSNDGASDGLQNVTTLVRRVAVGLEGDELTMTSHGNLRTRKRTSLDFDAHAVLEEVELCWIDSDRVGRNQVGRHRRHVASDLSCYSPTDAE